MQRALRDTVCGSVWIATDADIVYHTSCERRRSKRAFLWKIHAKLLFMSRRIEYGIQGVGHLVPTWMTVDIFHLYGHPGTSDLLGKRNPKTFTNRYEYTTPMEAHLLRAPSGWARRERFQKQVYNPTITQSEEQNYVR